jgi:hypothetical protein
LIGGSVNLIARPLSGTHTISVAILSSSTTSALLQDDIYFGGAHQFLEAVLSIPEKSRDLAKSGRPRPRSHRVGARAEPASFAGQHDCPYRLICGGAIEDLVDYYPAAT